MEDNNKVDFVRLGNASDAGSSTTPENGFIASGDTPTILQEHEQQPTKMPHEPADELNIKEAVDNCTIPHAHNKPPKPPLWHKIAAIIFGTLFAAILVMQILIYTEMKSNVSDSAGANITQDFENNDTNTGGVPGGVDAPDVE